MSKFRTALIFIAGIAAGLVLAFVLLFASTRAAAQESVSRFFDVSAKHPAAASVTLLRTRGLVAGYPGNVYDGTRPVTRYEMAVALARFARYYDTSRTPIQASPTSFNNSPAWAQPSLTYLWDNKYMSASSPVFTQPGNQGVTADQFADCLSAVLDRISDRSLPPMAQ